MSAFTAFPKIPRLFKNVVITEKIDGTNGAIRIIPVRNSDPIPDGALRIEYHNVFAQSRNKDLPLRPLGMDDKDWEKRDNQGFAKWVRENVVNLVTELGPGIHFGEWWGSGIQRNYGLKEKRFSLFNRGRWGVFDEHEGKHPTVPGLDVVPVLYEGDFSTIMVEMAMDTLRQIGSYAAPGWMDPEGVVVYHSASSQLFKVTYDAGPKGAAPLKAVSTPPPTPKTELVLAA